MLVYRAKFAFSNFVGHLISPGKYSLQSFFEVTFSLFSLASSLSPQPLRVFTGQLHSCSLTQYGASNFSNILRNGPWTIAQCSRYLAMPFTSIPGLRVDFMPPTDPELASCHSPIQSWLRATHRSEVGYVLLQIKLCWLCPTEMAPDCLISGSSGDKDVAIIPFCLGMFYLDFAVSFSFLALSLSVQPSQLNPSPLIPVCICIDSS